MGFSSSINTSLLTLIAFFTLVALYLFFGKRIRILQKCGLFVSLIALIILTMSMTKENNQNDEAVEERNFQTYKLLGISNYM